MRTKAEIRADPDRQSSSSPSTMLTGRESLIRLIGKRRRFLPNRQSLLSAPIEVLSSPSHFPCFPCLVPGKISEAHWNKNFAFLRPISPQPYGAILNCLLILGGFVCSLMARVPCLSAEMKMTECWSEQRTFRVKRRRLRLIGFLALFVEALFAVKIT